MYLPVPGIEPTSSELLDKWQIVDYTVDYTVDYQKQCETPLHTTGNK